MNGNDTNVTQYMLQFCYHCEDAELCATEEQCKACMAEHMQLDDEEDGAGTTRELLNAYYA